MLLLLEYLMITRVSGKMERGAENEDFYFETFDWANVHCFQTLHFVLALECVGCMVNMLKHAPIFAHV